jgi:hypothetical protein
MGHVITGRVFRLIFGAVRNLIVERTETMTPKPNRLLYLIADQMAEDFCQRLCWNRHRVPFVVSKSVAFFGQKS